MQSGLADEQSPSESFDQVLATVDIPDTDWRLGNYQILEEIGRGGMGVIYRARQRHSRRIVALKRVLSYHSDSHQTLARFQREAEAAASLDHPHILPIYEVGGTEEGLPFFSMKFASGGSLLESKTAFSRRPRQAVELLAKVARAVEYAHSHGILHRDLKPGNILLDARGEPLVSDFGLAKWIEATSDLTRTMTVFGTPGYISPEQVHSPATELSPAVDIYSLGAILFELLCGRPPFFGEHAIAVVHQAAEKQAPKLRSIDGNLPRDLETICARCLEREPAARYQSAGLLADDLERWLEHRPISARPVSAPVQLWRWAVRNPQLAAACVACVGLASLATGRQLQSRRLERAVEREGLAAHSSVVLPVLNLDSGAPDDKTTTQLASALQLQLARLGPARIVQSGRAPRKWTGTGNIDEVRLAAEEFHTRAVLTGTLRSIGERQRVVLHLFSQSGSDSLGKWDLEISSGESIATALQSSHIVPALYRALPGETNSVAAAEPDLAMQEPVARGYFNAGRALLERRTIPDMDRAINCFEEAVRAAPRSVAAHAHLALAYMGRNFLTANPLYMQRGFEAANAAVKLSPDNVTAHRALCSLHTAAGHFAEALEHGLRALEAGDPSERALGQIGYVWRELGRPDKAIQWFYKAKVSERQPADYDALLGDCWTLLTADDRARAAYQTAANFHPELPEGWLGLCHLKLLNRDFDGARGLFQQHAAEYQPFHTVKPLIAQIEFFARNFEEAERLYDDIRQADPHGVGLEQYGGISSGLALTRLKFARGDNLTAKDLLKQSMREDEAELARAPRHPEVLYRLAAGCAMAGDTSRALDYLRRSIAAGWLDYRSTRLDPRFDRVAADPRFEKILSDLATHVSTIGRSSPAELNGEITLGGTDHG